MTRRSIVLAGVLAFGALLVPAAQAGPAEDYAAIKSDWAAHGGTEITPCRFSQQQLVSAAQQSAGVADDAYNSFRDALKREYSRQQAGGCTPSTPSTPSTPTDPGTAAPTDAASPGDGAG